MLHEGVVLAVMLNKNSAVASMRMRVHSPGVACGNGSRCVFLESVCVCVRVYVFLV